MSNKYFKTIFCQSDSKCNHYFPLIFLGCRTFFSVRMMIEKHKNFTESIHSNTSDSLYIKQTDKIIINKAINLN